MRNVFEVKHPYSQSTKMPLNDDELSQIKNRIINITQNSLATSNKVVEVKIERYNPINVTVTVTLYHEVSQEKLMQEALEKIVKACWNMQYAIRFERELLDLSIPTIV